MTSFQQPIGPKSDLAELEYIAALHQTCFPDLRKDCSISSTDVLLFLSPRYGLKIDEECALDVIRGLGGKIPGRTPSLEDKDSDVKESLSLNHGDSNIEDCNGIVNGSSSNSITTMKSAQDSSEEYLDLIEWFSALLIPTLIKATQESPNTGDRWNSEIVRMQEEVSSNIDFLDLFHNNPTIVWKKYQLKLEIKSLKEKLTLLVDHDLVEYVRRILINSTKRNHTGPLILNESLVQELLRECGEIDSANDEELVAEMVECGRAAGPGRFRNKALIFDSDAFCSVLTTDILAWNCGIEDKLSTPFFDVYGCDPKSYRNTMIDDNSDEEQERQNHDFEDQHTDRVPGSEKGNETSDNRDENQEFNWWPSIFSTVPSIDSVVDTHQSILFTMAVWAYFIFSVGVYMTFINATNYDIFHCGGSFECVLINRIWTWFSLGFLLTIGGLIIMIPISIANDPYKVTWQSAAISAGALMVFTIVPYLFIVESYKSGIPHGEFGEETNLDRTVLSGWFQVAIDIYLAYGLLLLIFIPKHVAGHHCSQSDSSLRNPIRRQFLSTDLKRSSATKRAATRKINSMLQNAKLLHMQCGDQCDRQGVIAKYLTCVDRYSDAGGVLWSFRMLLTDKLLCEHGVWIQSTLAVAQEGQVLVFVLLITILLYETAYFAEYTENLISEVETTRNNDFVKDLVLWYIPRSDVIRKSSYVGIAFATSVGIVLIVLYLPSTVSTVLKLRSGALPSMDDEFFTKKYRYSADTTYYNLGKFILKFLIVHTRDDNGRLTIPIPFFSP